MGFTIYQDLVVKTNKPNVFEAISNPTILEKWWPLKCSGQPEVGATYNFNFTDEYDWYAVVASCKTNDHIHYKMTKSDVDWNPTTFGFDLETHKHGTQLKFWHKDWPECNDHFKHSSFCWALLLKGLKDYLEKGIVIPFEERS
ncbi:SRPBCC domain-containing protein [Winogradskyella maritima]|uniref:SRPBCC domain-containing protein n=1 Tax=Winogradskyella maritima TaxID=1517766 RepID=A0ABV8AGQ1_9FLAO|nr:SRPBCC domain-containing protein [Winogradskyella maritima]